MSPPLHVRELCRLLGDYRGRPIQLVPYALPAPGPFGLWIATDTVDLIFYQQETSPLHQDHIILHEVGHILADDTSDEDDPVVWQSLLPALSYDAIRRALRRTAYEDEREREAELIATTILEWSTVLSHVTPRDPEDTALGPLRFALHPRWGWM
ncbi:hypothetical protein NX801_09235 [Streptomyces sp. LP05-1]|uniref:IrrE N-terminal-like domain-containing protein n=1 Tax=Streptomyces pyxinae TaxID=2970734 RepID=A0ABT2CEL4_9ACTN|nr:hypothetical protein [Streptomyces sp. LP05-1]MCS0635847.1 hypothetical protein [Streptomyces sp. LP05-1]